MKKQVYKYAFVLGILLSAGGKFVTSEAAAQGTIYISNLSQPALGYDRVYDNSPVAQRFFTGTDPNGYALNSIQLLLLGTVGTPNGFSVSIYGNTRSEQPSQQTFLGTLSGTSPSLAGVYTYTASGIILLPSTTYFIVVAATSPSEDGDYRWSIAQTDIYSSINGWEMSLNRYLSGDQGNNWTASGNRPLQFAINATMIPEPSTVSLVLIFSGVLLYVCRARKS